MKETIDRIASAKSEELKAAAERYRHVEALDEGRKGQVKMVMALCEFARLAYESASGYSPMPPERTPEDWERARKMAAGEYAGQYLIVWREIESGRGGYPEALKVVQGVSDWLHSRGLNGIPRFVTESATSCKAISKSAAQMHHDMLELRRFAKETRAEMEARETQRKAA